MSVILSASPIDLEAFRKGLEDITCGGAVFFEGRVRDHNEGKAVERLEYEAYVPLSVKEGEAIIEEARARWSFARAAAVHRTGMLELGEVAVIVGVVSAHRDEAFQAARYLIDEIKARLPIWKREHYVDGERVWVNCQHCGVAGQEAPTGA